MKRLKFFNEAQAEQFLREGYAVVSDAFPCTVAEELVEQFWAEAPIDRGDRTGWKDRIVLIQKRFTPESGEALWSEWACAALDDLLGEGNYNTPHGSGWPLLNLPGFATPPWTPPTSGFHIDGIHFHHHLDSPEQGLIGLLLFTDVAPGGGGTAIKPGSHYVTAQILRDAEPAGLDHVELARRVDAATVNFPVVEVLGNVGDILMMHPHLYHASSPNCTQRVRIASNFCVSLKQKMTFQSTEDRPLSLVEQAISLAVAIH